MSETLAVRHRPRHFKDMVGQNLTALVLARMIETQQIPSGMLFSGPSGTGKTTAARIFAHGLDPATDPRLTVTEIDAASNGGVADMRALTESLRYSTGGNWRVVIIDEAHSLTRDAFNALLKTLEEPPPGTVFVLVTTEPHKIPETTCSRLMEFEFRRVSAAEIFDRLVVVATAERAQVTEELLRLLSSTSEGSVRKAVMDLEKAMLAEISTPEQWAQAVSLHDASTEILDALSLGHTDRAFDAQEAALVSLGHPSVLTEQIVRTLRDLLVLRSGGTLDKSGDALDVRKVLATRLEAERVVAALKILWDLKTRIRASDDPRGNLDIALVLMGEIFMRGRAAPVVQVPVAAPVAPPVASPSAAPRRLTLSELQAS